MREVDIKQKIYGLPPTNNHKGVAMESLGNS